ncbi:MAG: cyclic nucleotide-binding and patatin-like phospholipase domain-containing protein [Chloroflexota bacterium]
MNHQTMLLKVPQTAVFLDEAAPAHDFVSHFHQMSARQEIILQTGEVLFYEGEAADAVYVLVNGRLCAEQAAPDGNDLLLEQLTPGSLVGELAVWTGQLRTLTIRAAQPSRLFRLRASAFKQWLRANPTMRQAVAAIVLPRIQELQVTAVLKQIFPAADASFLRELRNQLIWHHLPSGQTLFAQGEAGDSLFVVVNGRLHLRYQDENGTSRLVAEAKTGEMVGEYAVLTESTYATTAVAVRESNIVELSQAAFKMLWEDYPHTMLELTRSAVRRNQQILSNLEEKTVKAKTFAVVPASPDVDIATFAHDLLKALDGVGGKGNSRYGVSQNGRLGRNGNGRSRHLTSQIFDSLYGQIGAANMPPEHPIHPLLVNWLNSLEADSDYLLFVTDSTWTEWTRRCLRQADRILIVANAANDPTPTLIEQSIAALEGLATPELILLHEPHVDYPSGTINWLNSRMLKDHHHIRRQDASHYQRLARRLTGQANALVLAGGGAKGYAHVGVFRAIQETGVPIDMIGGTSMGALAGGAIALDWDYTRMVQLSRRFANSKSLFDYTLPLVSFFASKKVTDMLKEITEGRQLEDLWRPFFTISSNLTRAEVVVHRRGPLWKAIRASLSIPGIFSPVLHENGDVLVDGGMMNNFPVDIMHDIMGGGNIIGSTVDQSAKALKKYAFDTHLSGWEILWRRLNPWAKPIKAPSLMGLLMRSAMLNSTQQTNLARRQANVLVEPDVSAYGLLAFERYQEIINVGYQTARQIRFG